VLERFWRRVSVGKPDECWLWLGQYNNVRYGRFDIYLKGGRGKHILAHRFAYEDVIGPIPRTLVIDHMCNNRGCVNPAHLRVTTQRENILRGTSGSAINAAKTHCPAGHPYSGSNLSIRKRGRACKACARHRFHANKAKPVEE
jgi:hypothetical protein